MREQSGIPRTVKVLTVNVHKGFTIFNRRFILHELREAIRSTAPDVIFLQEVLGEHHRHAARLHGWPTTSHYEFLADTIWSDFAYGRNAVYPAGHHGNAVLSKYPISTYENHDVSVNRHEARGMLHCIIETPGGGMRLHAVCVHLGLRESHRRQQLRRLCELVHTAVPDGEPAVVAGDFNDWRLKAGRHLDDCGLIDVFAAAHGRPVRTFPAQCPLLQLDRIYVRNVARHRPVPMARRPWNGLSDHLPLVAEIDV
ncbi:endonuclease/exonuclease/phosphatase family protein [Pusillimonas noertemannii]|uniref:Endonuclease/exonuclease/phosphatase family metal-dependent hydrolase n=1 Tax=Pusillimonas noertemannii TaxID=305977 RepID=A0A2U1CJG4_9BURK|nr:endonuclease/exonuclease/phosphatase family protein [Pusillimonas noertemannii]NYT69943.1 endonuclease/exonuclease/phosphatase family protein [Pusillimonas noertemannii]PVY61132.1 endonuclease/exonuclease/phosphatase family metal-dependent hydrolase [Pusillimonas noertemannii]TFL09237.1 endonuclease/exonuclease/phosphatase family protein [Pusillimonas noertemannii]